MTTDLEQPKATTNPRADALHAPRSAGTPLPRRVLFVDHTASLGGGEIALLNLVKHLDPSRYHPVVVLFSDGPLKARLDVAGIETHLVPLDPNVINTRKDSLGGSTLLRVRDVLRTIGFVRRLARFFKEQRADVVHTNSLKADIIGGLAARLAGVTVIWHVRDRIDSDYLPAPVVFVFRLLCRVVPTFVVANSAATLRTLALKATKPGEAVPSGIHLPGRRTQVVHDGTLADDTPDASPSDHPVIGLIGRISPWKGQHVFLQAAAVVRGCFPKARFQIIGAALFSEQAYEQKIHQMVNDLDLGDAVEFLGFRNDVQAVVGQLDVLVHASTTGEPFGQVIIEGMAAAKPVIATNGGGVPEIVVDGVTGLLVPMGDAEAMAQAVCRVLEDPALASRMGRLGRQRVLEHFTIEHTADRVQALYDRVLPAPDPGTSGARNRARRSLVSRAAGNLPKLDRRAVRASCVAVGLSVVALVLKLVLVRHLGEGGVSFATFFAAVLLSAWMGGFWPGIVAVFTSAVLATVFLLSPSHSMELLGPGRIRLGLFVGVSTLAVMLIERLHAANRRAEAAWHQAEADRERSTFLALASTTFTMSLDPTSILSGIAYLATSYLADWCVVDVVEAQTGAVRRAAGSHRAARYQSLLNEALQFSPSPDSVQRIAKVLRSAAPELSTSPDDASLEAGVEDARHLRTLRALGHASYIIVPLISAGRVVGAVTLVRSNPGDPFERRDLTTASELAMRAALALDNARLYERAKGQANAPVQG